MSEAIHKAASAKGLPDQTLQKLKDGQVYVCDKCDSRTFTPVVYDFEYFRHEDVDRNIVERRTCKDYQSDCCDAPFQIFDTISKKYVKWNDAEEQLPLPC